MGALPYSLGAGPADTLLTTHNLYDEISSLINIVLPSNSANTLKELHLLQEKHGTLRQKELAIINKIHTWHQGLVDQQETGPGQEDEYIHFLEHHLRGEEKWNTPTLLAALQERNEAYPDYAGLSFIELIEETQSCIELHNQCTLIRANIQQTLSSQHKKHQAVLTDIADQKATHTNQIHLTEHTIATRINKLPSTERTYLFSLWGIQDTKTTDLGLQISQSTHKQGLSRLLKNKHALYATLMAEQQLHSIIETMKTQEDLPHEITGLLDQLTRLQGQKNELAPRSEELSYQDTLRKDLMQYWTHLNKQCATSKLEYGTPPLFNRIAKKAKETIQEHRKISATLLLIILLLTLYKTCKRHISFSSLTPAGALDGGLTNLDSLGVTFDVTFEQKILSKNQDFPLLVGKKDGDNDTRIGYTNLREGLPENSRKQALAHAFLTQTANGNDYKRLLNMNGFDDQDHAGILATYLDNTVDGWTRTYDTPNTWNGRYGSALFFSLDHESAGHTFGEFLHTIKEESNPAMDQIRNIYHPDKIGERPRYGKAPSQASPDFETFGVSNDGNIPLPRHTNFHIGFGDLKKKIKTDYKKNGTLIDPVNKLHNRLMLDVIRSEMNSFTVNQGAGAFTAIDSWLQSPAGADIYTWCKQHIDIQATNTSISIPPQPRCYSQVLATMIIPLFGEIYPTLPRNINNIQPGVYPLPSITLLEEKFPVEVPGRIISYK